MPRSIYLINPREHYPAYDGTESLFAWGISDRVGLADLTMPTVAAMVPDGWRIAICDERIEPVDLDTNAEVIGLTGKISQRNRCIELAAEFRRRGKIVLLGGPYASLCPDDMRPHADVLVRGEMEDIAAELFADLERGTFRSEYVGDKPDLSRSPVPRWDLTRKGRALFGQVQTSRGCPFECEFCDVIQYLGRKQRWKEPEQVLRELDILYARGLRGVFFADDNLTVVRRRARALLEALRDWNGRREAGRVNFSTQVSIDIARDADLLQLAHAAGFQSFFIGIETTNEASLAEMRKRQNLHVDLVQEVRKVVEAGMLVTCGIIVGFDHDDIGIFERQAAFIASLPTPLMQVNVLAAPFATPLYARLKQEGRIEGDEREGPASLLHTNVRPRLMTQAQLKAGATWLVNTVYAPSAFADRLETFADICGRANADAVPDQRRKPGPRPLNVTFRKMTERLAAYGEAERRMLARVGAVMERRPDLSAQIMKSIGYYCQARYMYESYGLWNPSLAERGPLLAA
jgi:radical SAM superfamily enzyme YgiQ (UPF0313 family)